MVSSTLRRGSLAICAALLLPLTACSALGDAPDPSPSSSGTPLDAYYSLLYGALDEGEITAQNAAIQESVAACMKDAGFDYTPEDGSGTMIASDSLGMEWGSEEFIRTYGFGIATDPYSAMQSSGEYVDPNADYVASLSDSEQAAYNEALWGAPLDGASSGVISTDDYDWQSMGCMGAAQHDETSATAFWDDPEYKSLIDEMNGITDKTRSTPAVQGRETEWAGCMADAGFPEFTHHDDPEASINERYSALTTPTDPDSAEATAPDPAALAALKSDEIDIAVAAFGCDGTSGYADALKTEQIRLEQEFIDENKEQLDALVAQYGQQ